jgi:hypothetical protein
MKQLSLIVCALAFAAIASAQTAALPSALMLERNIEPSAAPGDIVWLIARDTRCRYAGELVRDPVDGKSVMAGLTQAAGGDGGAWHIDVSRRMCEQLNQPVKLRIDLPKPPSLAGGGGIPPNPYGYQSGATLPVRPN